MKDTRSFDMRVYRIPCIIMGAESDIKFVYDPKSTMSLESQYWHSLGSWRYYVMTIRDKSDGLFSWMLTGKLSMF